jgi:hypothetical protein
MFLSAGIRAARLRGLPGVAEEDVMGVEVVPHRVARRGTSPKRRRLSPLASVGDEDGVIARTFSGSGKPMLSRVDPYGDLVLSPAEMGQFIAEAESLAAGAGATGAGLIRRVLELARRCRDMPGTELTCREIRKTPGVQRTVRRARLAQALR